MSTCALTVSEAAEEGKRHRLSVARRLPVSMHHMAGIITVFHQLASPSFVTSVSQSVSHGTTRQQTHSKIRCVRPQTKCVPATTYNTTLCMVHASNSQVACLHVL